MEARCRHAWFDPAGAAPAELKQRTLTNQYNRRPTWLANLHAALDRAVGAADGWGDADPATEEEDAILARLLALNLARAVGAWRRRAVARGRRYDAPSRPPPRRPAARRRVPAMPRLFALVVVLLALALAAPPVGAQDATPMASPAAGPCEAPELPPGTPTPPEEGTPAAEGEATPGVDEEQADVAVPEGTPVPPPVGTPTTGADADAAVAGLENWVNCLNAGDYLAVAALLTDNFLTNYIGLTNPYDVPADLEGAQPVEIRAVGNTQTYDDGRVSVDWVYAGFFNGPGALSSERWFFVEEDGFYKLDNIASAPMPADVLPGATVVDVRMVDYAFALDTYTIPADAPVILRTTNASATGAPHVNAVVQLVDEPTAEAVIEGEIDLDDEEALAGFFGALFLEPGETGDLAFEGLAAGTYFLICDVETEDGTRHYELGMVTQITVE